MPDSPASAASVTHPFRTSPPGPCASKGDDQTHQEEASGAGRCWERIVVSEVMLRNAALAYAAVADLDPFDQRWRRCWRALRVAATGIVATMASARNAPRQGS